jgi:cell fate regulator YaaT (PSP1 superfamily)
MGCDSCGTASGGKPGGCKSNGGCSTGGCNRMNTHDWLRNLPISDAGDVCRIVEISFNQGSRKDFYRNSTLQTFEKGDMVALEGISGFDVGEVSLTGEIVRLQMKKRGVNEMAPDIKKVLRPATDRDLEVLKQNKAREAEALIRSRAIAKQLNLNMKMSQIEFQADGKKATFFYIADDRVDFREMIKIYASEFKVKVEMRQIGARQESGKVGGIGSCGRELCCATWLTDFKSVNTAAARYQNLSINQTKLSGQCGRLKCCLNYELDTYLDALQGFPENADILQVAKGTATLIKKDIFKNLMWYVLPQSNKQYPLTIERVRKIRSLNQQNVIPEELEPVEVLTGKAKEVEPEYVDLVGQISLQTLEKADRKKRDRGREQQRPQKQGNGQGVIGNRQAPQKSEGQQRQQRPPNPQQQRPANQAPGNGNRPVQRPQGSLPKPQANQRPQGNQQRTGPGGGNGVGNNQQRPAGGGQQQRPQRPQQPRRPQGDGGIEPKKES